LKGDLPLITADTGNLLGGKPGTKPTVEIRKLRTGSNAFFYEPISNDQLSFPADTP